MAAFNLQLTKGNKGDDSREGPCFRTSLNEALNAHEQLRSALEEELIKRFPKQLRWDRKGDESGLTIKTIANLLTFVTGEILRHFNQ